MPALVAQTHAADGSDSGGEPKEKKKIVLPLFGKRGSFRFSSSAASASSKIALRKTTSDSRQSDDEPPEEEELESAEFQLESITEAVVRPATVNTISQASTVEHETKTTLPDCSTEQSTASSPIESTPSTGVDAAEDPVALEATKKKRSRQRQRGVGLRANVDYDEPPELVSSEKYSTWVPPQNQSGDGSTLLNDKYGY